MKNPEAQKHEDIEIVCAMLNEKTNKLERGEKPGDATEVGIYGSKDGVDINIEELINNGIGTYEINYYPEKGSAERVFNDGTKGKVENIEKIKEIYKERKEAGREEHGDDKDIANDR